MEAEDRGLAAVAALNDRLRRRVYRYVTASDADVSRDDVAAALGVPRSVAAFHLDKLVTLDLLKVEHRRPPGRSGPGAGRPAKWYSRAAGEIAVSVPERHYELVATILARAVEDAARSSAPVSDSVRRVARAYGRTLGAQHQSPSTRRDQLVALLVEQGYEPRPVGDIVTLANCPFHALAEDHRELVCGISHELIKGAADAAGLADTTVRLDPEPGRCCVALAL